MGGNLRDPSASDKAAIAISPITSSISILSSLTLVYIIVSDREVKLKKPNNRFLLVMSIFDIIHSLAFAVIALPLPIDSGIYGARGNHWTCAIQGFMVQIGATVPCYNACICVWSWVHIKYNIHPDLFKEKIEPYCHALSIGAPLLLAIFNAAVDLYGPRGFYCWVIIEKTLKSKIATGAGIAIYFISGTIMCYCLIRIYHLFLQQEQQMRRYSTSPSGMQWRPNPVVTSKRAAAKQGLLYTLAFVITYFFAFLNVAVLDNAHGDTTVFGLLQAVFMPLQVS